MLDLQVVLRTSDFYFICSRPEMHLDRPEGWSAASPTLEAPARRGFPRPAAERRDIELGRVVTEGVQEATSTPDYSITMTIENGELQGTFSLDLHDLLGVDELPVSTTVEWAREGVMIQNGDLRSVQVDAAELLEWFSTDKVVFDRSRGEAGITGLDNLRALLRTTSSMSASPVAATRSSASTPGCTTPPSGS